MRECHGANVIHDAAPSALSRQDPKGFLKPLGSLCLPGSAIRYHAGAGAANTLVVSSCVNTQKV
jgi:hypothetical protein